LKLGEMLNRGVHYPFIAVAGLFFSFSLSGTPITIADAWSTAISFPVGGYCVIRCLRARSSRLQWIGVALTVGYAGLFFLGILPVLLWAGPIAMESWSS